MRTPSAYLGASVLALAASFALSVPTGGTMLPGGGSKRTDCIVELSASGAAFPAGRGTPLGVTCTDGDTCDQDGVRNGVCQFATSLCINSHDAALPRCKPTDVRSIRMKGARRVRAHGKADMGPLQSAAGTLGLPSSAAECTSPIDLAVPVSGPDRRGELHRGVLQVRAKSRTSHGAADPDRFTFVCLPGGAPPGTPPPPARGTPGAGLHAAIVGATISPMGTVQITFTLTDDAGVPVEPTLASTTTESQARARFTIARLEVDTETREGFTTDFTRYRNYITVTQTGVHGSADQPTYDSNGSFALADAATGTWIYTFGTVLPAEFPTGLTHTVGAQIERTFQGVREVANPVFDVVPAGGAVTTMRELTTTAQCNSCHGQLQAHGGGRREVRLCQLCHTDQAFDPDTGNAIDFKVMIHRIHRGKELPSVADGPVGSKYSIIGFQQTEVTFAEHVTACSGGSHAAAECASDADCPGGTCTADKTVGVGFPQDLRNCEKCHAGGATAANYRERPSAPACASCHDDVNPGETTLNGLPPGTNHGHLENGGTIGGKPDAFCRLCHVPAGPEFGISVLGAHTVPGRSMQLAGLRGEILSAEALRSNGGTLTGAVQIRFRITDGAGTPLPTLAGKVCARGSNVTKACTTDADCPGGTCVAVTATFALSGPASDLGGGEVRTCAGGGRNGLACTTDADCPSGACVGAKAMITASVAPPGLQEPPDAAGVYTFATQSASYLPASASGTWRVGLEARRSVTIDHPGGTTETVNEAVQNPVFDFSVDGSPVLHRRDVVDIHNCASCHGTFSVDFSVHGNLRNQTEYCVVCHNPNVSDFARRSRTFCAVTCGTNKVADTSAAGDDVQLIAAGAACSTTDSCAVGVGPDGVVDTTASGDDGQRLPLGTGAADAATSTIALKSLIHHIHTGEELETKPYLVYGFGAAPAGFTPNDFGDIRFPRDRRDCAACHVGDSELLPLPDGVIPDRRTVVVLNPDSSKWPTAPFVEATPSLTPPVQGACLACHDADDAKAHAETQTAASGAEACGVCHEEGKIEAVSAVHHLAP